MTEFTQAEWESIDKQVKLFLREPPILEVFSNRQTANGKQEHLYLGAHDMPDVVEGQDFSYDIRNYPARTSTGCKITYLTFPVKITRTDIDASSSQGIESLVVTAELEGQASMMKKIEKVILHGSDVRGSKGICNYSGKLSYGNNSNIALTTYGNFGTQLDGAISAIRAKHITPPYDLIWTPGIPAEMRGNFTGAHWSNELDEFKKIYKDNGLINRVIESDAICTNAAGKSATLGTANQCFIVAKFDQSNNYVVESYPLHRDGINKKFDSDVAYALKWAGGFVPRESNSVCLVTGLTTTSAY